MIAQNYLQIENNVVTNIVYWDGNTQTWQPPADATMLVQADTQAQIWIPTLVDGKITDYVLTPFLNAGAIGFTWNGSVLTTDEPKPAIPS